MHIDKFLPKQSVSIEKKGKNSAWSKVFLSHFYKVLLKQMCFGQYFNMCMETFYQNKVFLFKFFINFNWNQCVSVNILICTCTNWIKPFVLVEKKTARTLLDQKCFSHIFIKFYSKQMCFSQYFNMCKDKFYQNTLFW